MGQRQEPLYAVLAQLVGAYLRCKRDSTKAEWQDKHEARIKALVERFMPHGSGFDNGTTLDLDESNDDLLVFQTAFHHMNDGGAYDGWTEHTVRVKPSLVGGFRLRIGGRDRNQIKDLIGDAFHTALHTQTEMF